MIRERNIARIKTDMNNLADVFAYLDTLNNKEEAAKSNWEEQLFQKYPELADMEKKKTAVMMDSLRRVVENPLEKDAIVKETSLILRELDSQISSFKEKNSIEPYVNRYICPKCNGKGYIGDSFCSCVKKIAYKELFGARTVEDIKVSYKEFNTGLFKEKEQLEESENTKNFLEDYFESYPDNDRKILVFVGAPGLGKTYHIESFLKMLSEKEDDICIITAYKLFDEFHQNRLGESENTQLLYDAKVLAIDDLGSEPITQNVTREYFFDLLQYRIENGLHTLFGTNSSIVSLQERYSGRVASRLTGEDSMFMEFSGYDLRRIY